MHECLRFSMRICRWAGFFPVEGLDKPTISGLRYYLKGFYNVHCLIIYYFFLIYTAEFIFYATGLFSTIMLARLAQQWPIFINKVTEIEQQLQEIRTSNKTDKYCNVMAFCVLIAALVEHILSMIYAVYLITKCKTSSNDFSIVGNFQTTFLWNFTDVLTICFSIYLISYFQDLNKVINNRQVSIKAMSWERLRTHYSHIVELVRQVDARLSVFILQSFVTYIFYICTQLFHTLKTTHLKVIDCDEDIVNTIKQSPEYITYYVFSFLYLVLRFVITSLLAANVNLVAKMPLAALDTVPSSDYCLEVRRFRMQIEYTPVAMSGLFFFVTRPILLQVVGSIVTYELVMLQLH
ncbi:gustatory receptor for sugar taste 64f-like [Amyelois transitella]|uniref:gustatory receptor for sugar taste 64f-like n=1 Tax=Amyelois transitella TaxID=680683 RepID=UPI00298FD976|nr:gustatory receptor for sugar taste 64f-like [Amyelois transitella]